MSEQTTPSHRLGGLANKAETMAGEEPPSPMGATGERQSSVAPSYTTDRIAELERRIAVLEKSRDFAEGFWDGIPSGVFWGFVVAIPILSIYVVARFF